MPAKMYQKKPVINEAMQWTGDNAIEMIEWVGNRLDENGDEVLIFVPLAYPDTKLWVEANQSYLPMKVGEWVIKDASGFYPCLNERFVETYGDVTGPVHDPVVNMKLEHAQYGAVTVQVLVDAPTAPMDTALWALTTAARPDFALKMWNAAHPEDPSATIEAMMALQDLWVNGHQPANFVPIQVVEMDDDDDEA